MAHTVSTAPTAIRAWREECHLIRTLRRYDRRHVVRWREHPDERVRAALITLWDRESVPNAHPCSRSRLEATLGRVLASRGDRPSMELVAIFEFLLRRDSDPFYRSHLAGLLPVLSSWATHLREADLHHARRWMGPRLTHVLALLGAPLSFEQVVGVTLGGLPHPPLPSTRPSWDAWRLVRAELSLDASLLERDPFTGVSDDVLGRALAVLHAAATPVHRRDDPSVYSLQGISRDDLSGQGVARLEHAWTARFRCHRNPLSRLVTERPGLTLSPTEATEVGHLIERAVAHHGSRVPALGPALEKALSSPSIEEPDALEGALHELSQLHQVSSRGHARRLLLDLLRRAPDDTLRREILRAVPSGWWRRRTRGTRHALEVWRLFRTFERERPHFHNRVVGPGSQSFSPSRARHGRSQRSRTLDASGHGARWQGPILEAAAGVSSWAALLDLFDHERRRSDRHPETLLVLLHAELAWESRAFSPLDHLIWDDRATRRFAESARSLLHDAEGQTFDLVRTLLPPLLRRGRASLSHAILERVDVGRVPWELLITVLTSVPFHTLTHGRKGAAAPEAALRDILVRGEGEERLGSLTAAQNHFLFTSPPLRASYLDAVQRAASRGDSVTVVGCLSFAQQLEPREALRLLQAPPDDHAPSILSNALPGLLGLVSNCDSSDPAWRDIVALGMGSNDPEVRSSFLAAMGGLGREGALNP